MVDSHTLEITSPIYIMSIHIYIVERHETFKFAHRIKFFFQVKNEVIVGTFLNLQIGRLL